MDAELETGRQVESPLGPLDDGHVLRELPFKLAGVTHVVHPLVETARELRRDRLGRYALVGREDHQQLHRPLGLVGLIHGDLGDETALALVGRDVSIDPARLPGCPEELRPCLSQGVRADPNGPVNTRDLDRAGQVTMATGKGIETLGIRGAPDAIGHVNGEEIADIEKTLHVVEVDVVCVHVVAGREAPGLDRRVRLAANVQRRGADDAVLPE